MWSSLCTWYAHYVCVQRSACMYVWVCIHSYVLKICVHEIHYVCAHSFRVEQCIMHVKFIMYVCNEVHAYMCESAFRVELMFIVYVRIHSEYSIALCLWSYVRVQRSSCIYVWMCILYGKFVHVCVSVHYVCMWRLSCTSATKFMHTCASVHFK